MMTATAVHRVEFSAKGVVQLTTTPPDTMNAGSVRVRTICSLMSTGTETTALNGSYAPGTHWDTYVKYPFRPGYSTIGRVVEVGAEVTSTKVGDTVALRSQHASEHVVEAWKAHPVLNGIEPMDAAWFAMAKIAYVGASAANYALGEAAVIVGCGPIGQMSVRWAAMCGLRNLIVIDTAAHRVELAKSGGASLGFCGTALDAKQAILDHCGGRAPEVIVDTTGNPHVFADVLRLSGERGRVVLLGDAGSPDLQHLTGDLIQKGLTITAGHDIHILESAARPVYQQFFNAVLRGRFNMNGLITDTYAPQDCAAAYATANGRRAETMGILFDWER